MDDLNPYLELALEAAEKASAFIRQESEKTLEVGYKGCLLYTSDAADDC